MHRVIAGMDIGYIDEAHRQGLLVRHEIVVSLGSLNGVDRVLAA